MSNFNSVYNFIAKDEFSRVAKKVNAVVEKQAKAINKSREAAKKHNVELQKLSKGMRNYGAKMGAFVTLPLALVGRSMIKAASQVEETNSKFKAVYESIEKSALSAAKAYSKEFGVAESTARKMLGATGDLLTGFKFSEERALALSKQVAVLSGDLSAFSDSGMTAAQISKALTSGMLGETEAVKILGIKIDQTTPKFNEMVKAKMKNENLDLAQAKSLIILGQIVEQTSKSVGAANRSWDEYAQVAKRSAERTKHLKEKFGVLLLPAATALTNALISLADWLSNLSPTTQKVILVVAGLLAVIAPLLIAIGLMIPAITMLAPAFMALAGGIATLAGGLMVLPALIKIVGFAFYSAFGPVGLIIAGISLAIGLLIAKWDKVKQFFGFNNAAELKSSIDVASKNETTGAIDINVNAPKGAVSSARTRKGGRGARLNTGLNTVGAT